MPPLEELSALGRLVVSPSSTSSGSSYAAQPSRPQHSVKLQRPTPSYEVKDDVGWRCDYGSKLEPYDRHSLKNALDISSEDGSSGCSGVRVGI